MAKAKKRVLSLVLSLAMLLALLPATALAEDEMEIPGENLESGITAGVPGTPADSDPDTGTLGGPESLPADGYVEITPDTDVKTALNQAKNEDKPAVMRAGTYSGGFTVDGITLYVDGQVAVNNGIALKNATVQGYSGDRNADVLTITESQATTVDIATLKDLTVMITGSVHNYLLYWQSGNFCVENAVLSASNNTIGCGMFVGGGTANGKFIATNSDVSFNHNVQGDGGSGIWANSDGNSNPVFEFTGGSLQLNNNGLNGFLGQPASFFGGNAPQPTFHFTNTDVEACYNGSPTDGGEGDGFSYGYITLTNTDGGVHTFNVSNNDNNGLDGGRKNNAALDAQGYTILANNNGNIGLNISKMNAGMNASTIVDCTIEANNNGGSGIQFSSDKTLSVVNTSVTLCGNGNSGLYNSGSLFDVGTVDLSAASAVTITGNSGSNGGGINNSGTVILPATAAVYNNHANNAGDDIYCGSGASITFGPVGSGWTLDDCGHLITGWYKDSEDQRWKAHGEQPFYAEEFTDTAATGKMGLKAAHGLEVTIKFVNYDGTVISEAKYKIGETIVVPTNPTRPADSQYVYTFAGWDPAVELVATKDATYQATYTATVIPPYIPPTDPGTDIEDPDVPLADLPGLNTVDHYAYIAGYEDGTVRPNNNITRAEVATVFFRLFTDEYRETYWSTNNPFSDVAYTAWYNNAVSTTANAGIIAGYPDGTFQPNNCITRAEFATIAARFLSEEYVGPDLFTDISGHWAAEYINRAANAGWINGYPDGSFDPDAYITRAEAMTLVNSMLGRMPHKDHMLENMVKWPDNPEAAWYYEAVQEATNGHDYDWYEEKDQRLYEIWTALQPNRDWEALEKEWSNAYSAPGGEVMG